MTLLNFDLIERQGLSDDDVAELEHLHEVREDLFELAKITDPADIPTLRTYAALLESLEFNMQRVWKFSQNRNMHTWWYRIPHCSCPKLDNQDNFGTKYRVFSGDCVVHSSSIHEAAK